MVMDTVYIAFCQIFKFMFECKNQIKNQFLIKLLAHTKNLSRQCQYLYDKIKNKTNAFKLDYCIPVLQTGPALFLFTAETNLLICSRFF